MQYASQGAGSGECQWDMQIRSKSGYPNGFNCSGYPGQPELPIGLDCKCNRLVVAAQITALSEAVGNITSTLKTKDMLNSSVIVFMGDNGGPIDGAHSNGALRGGKLNFFEVHVHPEAYFARAYSNHNTIGGYSAGWFRMEWAATSISARHYQ